MASHANIPSPMRSGDYSNKASPLIHAQRTRKWTKLICDNNVENEAAPILMDFDGRPGLESDEE